LFYLREASQWYYYFGAIIPLKKSVEPLMNNVSQTVPPIVVMSLMRYICGNGNNRQGVQESPHLAKNSTGKGSSW